MMGFLFLLCVIQMLSWTEANIGTFLITAPKALRVDAIETVVVQLFDQDQDTTVNLFLKDTLAPGSTTYVSESVKLNANNNYQAAASLRIFPSIEKDIKHVYLQAISGSFIKEMKIPVIRHNGFLFIQTNKPLYTPEQNVEVRVYALNEELRKTNRPVFLTFKDPDGIPVEMIEVNDIRGVKPLFPPFKIPLKPKFGVWKIEATYVNNFTTNAVAEFEVNEYVLPSMSVRIEPVKNYVSVENFEAFRLKLSAKYIHGEPVTSADVYITFGYINRDEVVMIPSTFQYQKMDDGELEVDLNIRRALASMSSGPQNLGQMENHVLRVAVVLQEMTGGISQEAVLSNVKFVHSPFTLSLIATPPFIKPSLPYSIRVLVKNPLGEPEKGVPVKARATWTNNDDESSTFKFSGYKQEITEMSQSDGVAYFICNIPNNAKSAEFTFETAVEQYPADSQAQLTLNTVAYTSPNQRYLYISLPSDSSAFEVDDYASIKVHFSFHGFLALKTFGYQIIARGKIVKYAMVNRVSEKEQGISFKVTGDMVPSARLLVYYILYGEQQAELVADSVWFNVKAKCVNGLDVKLVAKGEQYKPRDTLSLSVMTSSSRERSLLALSAVDTALYTLRNNDKDPLNKALQHFEDSDLGCGGGGGKNSADVFSRAGLTFLTNANVNAVSGDQTCSAVLRPKRFTPSIQELIETKATQYKGFKSCCLSGAQSSPILETCSVYTRRLSQELGLHCKKAFYNCCMYAQHLRKQTEIITLMRVSEDTDIEDTILETAVRRKRSSLDFNTKMEEYAKQFKAFKPCCMAGSDSSPTLETCEARAKRLSKTVRLECRVAFRKCCEHAQRLRMKISDRIILGRTEVDSLTDVKSVQIRSYFPESWLWQEYETDRSGLLSISKVLPDSLTTWEVKAVGLFNNGLCVADPLQVRVFQAVSVNVPLPYSMVRGEQIELKGSVYNYYESETKFSVALSASEGVCVFRGTLLTEDGDPHLNKGTIGSQSVGLVRFYIMALEVGNHELRFTLNTKWGQETVIKTLRVVPEGIRKEISVGTRLDPNGVYGVSGTRIELKNSLPLKFVPKSTVERQLTVNGEVVGELLSIITSPKGLMQLVNLPRGSGEVELMGLLPIFYVYDYLEQTDEWRKLGEAGNPALLRRKIKEGITSVMSFKSKREYSFSLWKNKEPSTWLTALVVKTLAYINKYVTVDHNALSNTVRWLIVDCQNSDGSFSEKSSYKPVKLMGAGSGVTEQSVFVTSSVVIGIKNALSVPKSNLEFYQRAMEKAMQYLYSEMPKVKSVYVRAITAYALTLVDQSSRPAVLLYEKLKKEAQTKGNPVTHRFWAEKDAPQDPLQPNKASAIMVETTVYMLLSALARGEIMYAKPILNWLTQDQRYGGGIHSTQDAVLTLEALTKYSILAQKSILNMVINVSYRKKGEIATVSLTQKNPMGKPIEITHAEDIILATGYNTGVAFAKLRTVYYEMIDSNTNCHFDISIDVHLPDSNSNDPMHLSPRIVACAKYKPRVNEVENEAGHTVMEINLPSGVSPIEADLKRFRDGLESLVSDYEITGDQVILQMDSIPSDEFYCVGFRIQEVFKIGMSSSSVFKVYEYHDPANQCTKLYYQQSHRLLRLCDRDQCQCMAAECCNFKSRIDPTITVQQRVQDVCKGDTSYVLKVKITSTEAEGDFMTYNAKVESVLENGLRDIKLSSEISLVKKATCTSTNLEIGKQYLIWGAEVMQIRLNRSYRYKFPLDSQASVEWWPFDSDCQTDSCHNYLNVLYDFELDFPDCKKVG